MSELPHPMPISSLSTDEQQVILECLKCVASGNVIRHDSEFSTIMGVEPEDLTPVINAWPNIDESSEKVFLAINNSMNNLLGYPHGKRKTWDQHMSIPLVEIARVFRKWRGSDVKGYFEGMA